jgi:hypothetical protein
MSTFNPDQALALSNCMRNETKKLIDAPIFSA